MTFLDVGQGDGALLESADGHAALIDTGPPEAFAHIRAVLEAHRITALDWVMFSHPHLDHIGSGRDVLDHFHAHRVIDPAFPHPLVTYDRLLERIQQLRIPFTAARAHDVIALGAGVRVTVLLPAEPFLAHTRSDANSNSIVACVEAGHARVLFTGDSERETEERLIASEHGNLRADVLKVAHHGSRYATTSGLLDEVSPRFAVISSGAGNDYGHPHATTLQALAARNIETHRTDLEGDVILETDGSSIGLHADASHRIAR